MAIAAVAVLLRLVMPLARTAGNLPFLPHVSRLSVGQTVVTRAARGTDQSAITAGTRCVVVAEPAWDADSCYPGREIMVRICEGRRTGEVVAIPRNRVRVP